MVHVYIGSLCFVLHFQASFSLFQSHSITPQPECNHTLSLSLFHTFPITFYLLSGMTFLSSCYSFWDWMSFRSPIQCRCHISHSFSHSFVVEIFNGIAYQVHFIEQNELCNVWFDVRIEFQVKMTKQTANSSILNNNITPAPANPIKTRYKEAIFCKNIGIVILISCVCVCVCVLNSLWNVISNENTWHLLTILIKMRNLLICKRKISSILRKYTKT